MKIDGHSNGDLLHDFRIHIKTLWLLYFVQIVAAIDK